MTGSARSAAQRRPPKLPTSRLGPVGPPGASGILLVSLLDTYLGKGEIAFLLADCAGRLEHQYNLDAYVSLLGFLWHHLH